MVEPYCKGKSNPDMNYSCGGGQALAKPVCTRGQGVSSSTLTAHTLESTN